MWNCVILLVTVYIICINAVPLYGSIENSTIYWDQNVENISTPNTNHDAQNLTTIRPNQISANITDHATKDDVSSTAKDEPPISSDSDEHVNNETNHQQESRYFNDEEIYTLLNLFGSDETNDNSETNNKSKECHDSNNSEGCSDTNDSEDSEDSDESEASKGNEDSKESEDSEKSEDSEGGEKKEDSEYSDDTDYSDYGDYGNYGDVSDETVDTYASDAGDNRNEIDNELYDVNYKGNVGSNEPNTKKFAGNDAKTNFVDYVRSESEAYHLYGDNVDEEGDECEDISSVNDVFGELPSIDHGETNLKLNMENSGHTPSIAFASYYINLIYLILILHFHMEYLT